MKTMFIEKQSLDDIIRELLSEIKKNGISQKNTKGDNKEILGVYVRLTNPLNRISTSFAKNIFVSPIGEFLWYMSGSNSLSFIQYYIQKYGDFSNDQETLNGAYGARLFNKKDLLTDQMSNVVNLLRKKVEKTVKLTTQIRSKLTTSFGAN